MDTIRRLSRNLKFYSNSFSYIRHKDIEYGQLHSFKFIRNCKMPPIKCTMLFVAKQNASRSFGMLARHKLYVQNQTIRELSLFPNRLSSLKGLKGGWNIIR